AFSLSRCPKIRSRRRRAVRNSCPHTGFPPNNVNWPILSRLLRIGNDDRNEEHLDRLGVRLLGLLPSPPKTRARVDSLLSHLYGFFFPPTRQRVLESWRSRGTTGAGGRWLKPMSNDPLLLDIAEVLADWRDTGDRR